MNAKEALIAAQWCGAQKVMGVHFDTFPPIAIDHEATKNLFDKAGIPLVLPSIGESINF
jgi:L-ascorbate metabolism protein UlaG (beta-lactamase superfamily)